MAKDGESQQLDRTQYKWIDHTNGFNNFNNQQLLIVISKQSLLTRVTYFKQLICCSGQTNIYMTQWISQNHSQSLFMHFLCRMMLNFSFLFHVQHTLYLSIQRKQLATEMWSHQKKWPKRQLCINLQVRTGKRQNSCSRMRSSESCMCTATQQPWPKN